MKDVFKKHGDRIAKEDANIPKPILDVLYSGRGNVNGAKVVAPQQPEPDWAMSVKVSEGESDKRGTLTSGINFALCGSGTRVTSGLYEVTIRKVRLTPTERRYLHEIRDKGAPEGWGKSVPEDGRKGVNVLTLARLRSLGLIEDNGLEFKLTSEGAFLSGERS